MNPITNQEQYKVKTSNFTSKLLAITNEDEIKGKVQFSIQEILKKIGVD